MWVSCSNLFDDGKWGGASWASLPFCLQNKDYIVAWSIKHQMQSSSLTFRVTCPHVGIDESVWIVGDAVQLGVSSRYRICMITLNVYHFNFGCMSAKCRVNFSRFSLNKCNKLFVFNSMFCRSLAFCRRC